MEWDLQPPKFEKISDSDVVLQSEALKGIRISLLVTGCIASYRIPDIIRVLRKQGAETQVLCSRTAFEFVTERTLHWTSGKKVISSLTGDAEHLDGEIPCDLYLVAPATYNTINKFAQGIADSVVTLTLASALGRLEDKGTPILICPAMHGSMHNSILMDSMTKLRDKGVTFVKPKQEDFKNKLPEPEDILNAVIEALK